LATEYRPYLVDEFISDTVASLGDEFRRADFEAWLEEKGIDANVGSALNTHRINPGRRVFITERVGFGPNTKYRVVGIEGTTASSVDRAAIQRMAQQQFQEAHTRFVNEHAFRMFPIAARSPAGRRSLDMFEAQMQHAMSALHLQLQLAEDDDE